MRLIPIAGLIVWIAIGIHVILSGATWQWCLAYVLFGIAFVLREHRAAIFVETGTVVAMVLLLCHGFEGTLLVLVAMQLGGMMSRRAALAYNAAQTALLGAAIAIHWSIGAAVLLAPPYLGFELLAFFTFEALAREAAAHAELRAVNEILADSSRIAERLRISRELHDLLGHHLTALSLNLEAALHRTEGEARGHVQTAQSLAKELLTDVRELAAAMQARQGVDLAPALRSLVAELPRPNVHLEIEQGIRIDDPERAHIVVRCTQEIVTNAARHSAAENLWITIAREGESVRISARDDGRGAAGAPAGFGLRSMRDRVEGAGGELRVGGRPGFGFEVVALLPARAS
jgi:signal transduction histidine kinase